VSVRCFIEQLGSIGPDRMRRLVAEGTVSDWFVYVGPENAAGFANRDVWNDYAGVGNLWAWYVCGPDQARDVAWITALDDLLMPAGWVLDIEKPLEGVPLTTLISGVKKLGQPIIASLAGASASHTPYDYRTLDKAGVQVDWQAYFDSGEGPTPAVAVEELYRSSFVLLGWEYRSRIGKTYGWGKVTKCSAVFVSSNAIDDFGYYDSYKLRSERSFRVQPRKWGWTVTNRNFEGGSGVLLGRAQYSLIAVTLDLTRGAQEAHSLAEWEAIAASARIAGARKRPVSCYLGEIASDGVLRAIAKGAG
jgi:hypothetical protein